MNSKGIIAIIVVIILVAAGVGVGVFFANQNNSTGDKVKDTIEKGDFINLCIENTSETTSETTKDSFLGQFYYTGQGILGEKTTIEFDGNKYECNTWIEMYDYATTTTYAIVDSHFILKKEMTLVSEEILKMTETLAATTLDVKKTMSEQEVKDGSTVTYNLDQNLIGLKGTGNDTYSYCIDKDQNETEIVTSIMTTATKITVESVEGDTIHTDILDLSKTAFRSNISLKDWIEYQKSLGFTITEGEKTTDKISTPFGDRNVTIQEYTAKSGMLGEIKYTLTYGSEGFLYSYSVPIELTDSTYCVFVTDTSMIV